MDEKEYKNVLILGGISVVDLSVEYLLKSPSDVAESEKNYVDNLKTYCESYNDKNTYVSEQLNGNYTTITNIVADLDSATNSYEISQKLGELIDSFQEGISYLSDYKNNLIALRDEASNLSIPGGLEILNKQYLDSINIQIDTSNTILNYMNNCNDILTDLKNAVDTSDLDRIDQEANRLENLAGDMDIISNMENGNEGISSLYTRITTALNSLQQ